MGPRTLCEILPVLQREHPVRICTILPGPLPNGLKVVVVHTVSELQRSGMRSQDLLPVVEGLSDHRNR